MITRPRDITSSVASCLASSTAERSGAITMPVDRRMRCVTPASTASTVSGSNHGIVERRGKASVGIVLYVLAHHHVVGDADEIDALALGDAHDLGHRGEVAAEPVLQPVEADRHLCHRLPLSARASRPLVTIARAPASTNP